MGEVFNWGKNDWYQLGNGSTESIKTPQIVKDLIGKRVIDIHCGERHTLALTENGELFAWGANGFGQVGNNSTSGQPTPFRLTFDIGNGPLSGLMLAIS
jgi:alpha-tubulin suppressor-like RCC1 family protein